MSVTDNLTGIGSIASPIAAVGGSIINGIFQKNENERNREWTEKQNNLAWQRQNQLINEQRAYDSPKEQMKRLMYAGLNPNLIYGDLGGNMQAQSAPNAAGSYQGVAPQVDPLALSQSLLNMANARKADADIDNQTRITDAQVDDIYGNTPYKKEVIKNLQATSDLINNQSKEVVSRIDVNNADVALKRSQKAINDVISEQEKERLKWLPDVMKATVYELYGRGAASYSQVSLNAQQEKVAQALVTYYHALQNQADANTALLNLQYSLDSIYGGELRAADIISKTNVVVNEGANLNAGPISIGGSHSKVTSLSQPFSFSDVRSYSNGKYILSDGSQYIRRNNVWYVKKKGQSKFSKL